MPATTKKATAKASSKKQEPDIIQKLEKALESYREALGEKKFSSRIRKAGKMFLKGLAKKTKAATAITVKKAADKKAAKQPAKKKKPATSRKTAKAKKA